MLEEAGEAPDRAPETDGKKPPRGPAGGVSATTRWVTSPKRLPWLLVALALVPVIVMAVFAETQTRSLLIDSAGRDVRNAAVSAMVSVETELRRTTIDAKSYVVGERIKEMRSGPAIEELTEQVKQLSPIYRQMVLVDTRGRTVAIATDPPGNTRDVPPSNFVGKSIGRPGWFVRALRDAQDGRANPIIQTVEPRPVIGELEGNRTAPLAPVTAIGVTRGGEPVGVLALFTNWQAFVATSENSTGTYAARAAQAGLATYLVDGDGRVLLAPGGKFDLGADVSSDPVIRQARRLGTAGFVVDKTGGPLAPGDTIDGYAPMDEKLGSPPLDWVTVVAEEESVALTDANRLTRVLVITTILVGIIATLIALMVSRSLTRRARQLRDSSIEVEAGSRRLQESAEASRSTAQLTEKRAADQIASIDEIRSLVSDMRKTGAQITESARLVSAQAGKAASAGEEGLKASGEVDEAMVDIETRVRAISGEISALAHQTAQISEIIATVSSIADQSNLLAFNATIEAAKAGEHGAGFTVVAEEVRMLAEQSKRATAQIRSILGEIDNATRDAEKSAEKGIEAVSEGRRRAESAAATIEELAAANREAERSTREIADAAPAQEAIGERFVEATDDVNGRSQAVQAAAHESARSAAELDTLAERLRELAKTLTEV